ncbi:MAG: hypothetical protein KF708_11415 [Pirellulales bacterium]|nr:hypothetical protein [Pirellulales bacterium]
MTELTPELRQAIAAASGPVELVDPLSQEHYFVVSEAIYRRLIATLELGEPSDEERKAQLQAFGRAAGWEDPESAIFDDLKPQ